MADIEYKSDHRIGKIRYPEISICFENPFLDEKLKDVRKDIDKETYLKFLRGEIFY